MTDQSDEEASSRDHASLVVTPSTKLNHLTDGIDAIKAIKEGTDITTVLRLARNSLLLLTKFKEDVKRQCALTFDSIWSHIADLERDNPEYSAEIVYWRQNIRKDLSTTKIDKYLSLAAETRRRMDFCTSHIQEKWGVKPSEVLPPEYYQPGSTLSRPVLQRLSALSDVSTLERGQEVLLQAINARHSKKRGAPLITDQYLKPRDVEQACTAVGAPKNKRKKRIAEPAAKPSKRSRTASRPLQRSNANDQEPDVTDSDASVRNWAS